MTTFDRINGDPDQMRQVAASWSQAYQDVESGNSGVNASASGLAGSWLGGGGRQHQIVELARFERVRKHVTTGNGMVDAMTLSSNKYFDYDSDVSQRVGSVGDFGIDGGKISDAMGTIA
ncbi:hypothetical protein ORV05_08765 [Amycolatopsis cynarae]|uniref:WXG100 family type VII secretion target n=1 Tax=Amycolatopsis cynarae TaxID=2995223 RepID=A0ABY7BAF5_9PSEU|nr:hypothetical protein [Amycolatopsis sp. HUAS 11-8]WAL67846.1 hypothetical protein ORV05_08765 [Amycolatopsis sp. HUAS 11-8]